MAEQWILRAEFDKANKLINKTADMLALQGWLDFINQNTEQAINNYETAFSLLKKEQLFSTDAGIFYILALLQTNKLENIQKAFQYSRKLRKKYRLQPLSQVYEMLQYFAMAQDGDVNAVEDINYEEIPVKFTHSLVDLIKILVIFWIDKSRAKKANNVLNGLRKQAKNSSYHWLEAEAIGILTQLDNIKRKSKHLTNTPIVKLIQPIENWQRVLNALIKLDKPQANTIQKESRLVWFLSMRGVFVDLQPREQKLNTQGVWTKGRPIALKRLQEDIRDFDFLTEQDIRACSYINQKYTGHGYYQKVNYDFAEKALSELVGHPLLFWANSNILVELVKAKPELLITKSDAINIFFSHPIEKVEGIQIFKETPTRLKLLEVTKEHVQVLITMGSDKITIPQQAQTKVLEAIDALSSIVTLHSEIGGGTTNLETITADSTPHIHLLPFGEGLKIALLIRPFKTGPYYRPGSGGETVIAEIDAKHFQAKRNLTKEKQLATNIIATCPTLNCLEDDECTIAEPEQCLEVLLELQLLKKQVIIEWPKGEKFNIKQQVGMGNLRLNIKQQKDWFSINGDLKLDDGLLFDMEELLKMLGPSRFIELSDGQFLALTQKFHKHLQELKNYSEQRDKGTYVHPLAAFMLEDFTNEAGGLRSDKHWKAHLKRLHESQTLEPTISSTFQAELRDYQVEGFNWLSRLAHWGVGACLADDMGLGKTIQALAVIVNHAPNGPSLVVAPTSVCINWQAEVRHFAPTLNYVQFSGNNRQQILDNLQPFDMLICSYGLLQQEAEKLADIHFQVIVLDEAQAIKNFATKRSQAAMNLQAEFKVLTTGTPIENHLGELWNLFRFINPGLLGSLKQFNQRYAVPIEKNSNQEARKNLKKLIQPFILRRNKSQVLEELPPRTEITLQVELSAEEMAFYEALRRQSVKKLTSSKAKAGQKHLQVLAEIMKLRRACCNPQLVAPEISLSSSKLNVFSEVLTELLDNKHKALVFSQFVDHLKIIRAYFDENNIQYQYLDGSTSIKERKKRVNAFQAGEGDVFLISLKAGGTGLNLTAADYVIHMDPWWNPAVEDQASDRVHRIGQQRPVTIYSKNSINRI